MKLANLFRSGSLLVVGVLIGHFGWPAETRPVLTAPSTTTIAPQQHGSDALPAVSSALSRETLAETASADAPAELPAFQPVPEAGEVQMWASRDAIAQHGGELADALGAMEKLFPGLWQFGNAEQYRWLVQQGVPGAEEIAWASRQSLEVLGEQVRHAKAANSPHFERYAVLTEMRTLQEAYDPSTGKVDPDRYRELAAAQMRDGTAGLSFGVVKRSNLLLRGHLKMLQNQVLYGDQGPSVVPVAKMLQLLGGDARDGDINQAISEALKTAEANTQFSRELVMRDVLTMLYYELRTGRPNQPVCVPQDSPFY